MLLFDVPTIIDWLNCGVGFLSSVVNGDILEEEAFVGHDNFLVDDLVVSMDPSRDDLLAGCDNVVDGSDVSDDVLVLDSGDPSENGRTNTSIVSIF